MCGNFQVPLGGGSCENFREIQVSSSLIKKKIYIFPWLRHEDVYGESKYISTHSYPLHYMEINSQIYLLALLHSENNPGTSWIEGWMGPRANLDVLEALEYRTVHP